MSKHPYTIKSYKDTDIEIDNDLIPLIDCLWNLDIETSYCCQGDSDTTRPTGYIAMPRNGFTKLVSLVGLDPLIDNTAMIDYDLSYYGNFGVAVRFHNRQISQLTNVVLEAAKSYIPFPGEEDKEAAVLAFNALSVLPPDDRAAATCWFCTCGKFVGPGEEFCH